MCYTGWWQPPRQLGRAMLLTESDVTYARDTMNPFAQMHHSTVFVY